VNLYENHISHSYVKWQLILQRRDIFYVVLRNFIWNLSTPQHSKADHQEIKCKTWYHLNLVTSFSLPPQSVSDSELSVVELVVWHALF